MDANAKLAYFQLLVQLGYKELEVSYPSASQTEYDFTRHLATTPGLVPDDVRIQVMAPCREDLIRRTVESVRGAKKVIVHLHVSTSECFRRVVFNKTEGEMVDLAVRCTRLLRQLTKDSSDAQMQATEWTYEFTAENFQDTSVRFAVQLCEAVQAAWTPTASNPIIFNLPSTVEVATPNVFADQIESFCRGLSERENVCVSLHPHNDRGCAVATAEMGQLAGADRVEGCLFGNGERTGNVDLVTLALNLYTHGISPGIRFSDLNAVVATVERLTGIPTHVRAPYAGRYVFCTFTGTHQDAIRKGYARRRKWELEDGRVRKWEMPFLPMDPSDLGRRHEAIIRVNAQSGKGGVAWMVREIFTGVDDEMLPPEMERVFAQVVQAHANATGHELTSDVVRELFEANYMLADGHEGEPRLIDYCLLGRGDEGTDNDKCWARGDPKIATGQFLNGGQSNGGPRDGRVVGAVAEKTHASVSLHATVAMKGTEHVIRASCPGIVSCVVNAVKELRSGFELLEHRVQSLGSSIDAPPQRMSVVKLGSKEGFVSWGVGVHEDQVGGTLQAVLKAWWKLAVLGCV